MNWSSNRAELRWRNERAGKTGGHGPAVLAVGLILMGLALGIGHLRFQQTNHELGEQLRAREFELRNIRETNSILAKQLNREKMVGTLLQKEESMNLNLRPLVLTQVVRLSGVELEALIEERSKQ